MSRQSVSKWESAASYPEMDTLLKLCDMFRVDMDTLLRGSVENSLSEDGLAAHVQALGQLFLGDALPGAEILEIFG